MIEFNFIPQQEIRNWWATIKPGLDEIKLKSPEPWIVEDVYVDLFNQKSMLWIATHLGGLDGRKRLSSG
jgi:hypothetical protein